MKLIALIPARMGSSRMHLKNFKLLNGKPLICYTIEAALKVKALEKIIVSTDYPKAIEIIEQYNDPRLIFLWRIKEISLNTSPDWQWIRYTFDNVGWNIYSHYTILRPTSPFRTDNTIGRAIAEYQKWTNLELSMKSVHLVSEYPQKMWVPNQPAGECYYIPYERIRGQSKPASFEVQSSNFTDMYIQDGCIDICPISIIKTWRNRYIGNYIYPFLTQNYERLDINKIEDWEYAEYLMKKKDDENE